MKLVSEFKAFITKGNILDMAVGVIIGGAFNTIVTTLNKQVLMPVVNWALSFISSGECLYTLLPNSVLATDADILAGAATVLGPDGKSYTVLNYINWSAFIESIINFFFIALTLFVIVKVASTMAKKRQEFNDKLKADFSSRKNKGEVEAVEEAPVVEEEPVVEEAPEVIEPKPTQEDLLQQIVDLLKEKNA